jgi:hypothetical protein
MSSAERYSILLRQRPRLFSVLRTRHISPRWWQLDTRQLRKQNNRFNHRYLKPGRLKRCFKTVGDCPSFCESARKNGAVPLAGNGFETASKCVPMLRGSAGWRPGDTRCAQHSTGRRRQSCRPTRRGWPRLCARRRPGDRDRRGACATRRR